MNEVKKCEMGVNATSSPNSSAHITRCEIGEAIYQQMIGQFMQLMRLKTRLLTRIIQRQVIHLVFKI